MNGNNWGVEIGADGSGDPIVTIVSIILIILAVLLFRVWNKTGGGK
jgi:hypothetical protein